MRGAGRVLRAVVGVAIAALSIAAIVTFALSAVRGRFQLGELVAAASGAVILGWTYLAVRRRA